MASIAGSSALSFAMPVKAINSNSLAFSPVRKGNTFLRLQPVPMRSVSCAAKKDTVDTFMSVYYKSKKGRKTEKEVQEAEAAILEPAYADEEA
uniref:Uncharacterized protein n=1 Tax=Zea mays TaxID=4577 RepID=B6U963_MAIZE|nr:hypothetical protein [Zea mays]